MFTPSNYDFTQFLDHFSQNSYQSFSNTEHPHHYHHRHRNLHHHLLSKRNFIAYQATMMQLWNEPRHEISNNVICATSKASNQPAHTHSLIKAFAGRLYIL